MGSSMKTQRVAIASLAPPPPGEHLQNAATMTFLSPAFIAEFSDGMKIYKRTLTRSQPTPQVVVRSPAAAFVAGLGLVLDIGGVTLRPRTSKNPLRDDARAIGSDWRKAGGYLRRAMKHYR